VKPTKPCCCQYDPTAPLPHKVFADPPSIQIPLAITLDASQFCRIRHLDAPAPFESPPLNILQCVWRC
jgi:hypothetical protein